MALIIQKVIRKLFPMAAQSRGSAFPDTTAVPLVDGGIDDRTKEVCQTGGTAGIYGMISVCRVFVQNREILRMLQCICRGDGSYGKGSSCHGFAGIYAVVIHVSFFERMY